MMTEENRAVIKELTDVGVEPVIAKLLVNRTIDSPEKAKRFFAGGLCDLPDAGLLQDMDRAIAIIRNSVTARNTSIM